MPLPLPDLPEWLDQCTVPIGELKNCTRGPNGGLMIPVNSISEDFDLIPHVEHIEVPIEELRHWIHDFPLKQ